MAKDPPKIRRSMLPLAWLYGFGVNFRNKLFDAKLYKQHKFDIPIICVGNITVGGTGKTPHIEYLIELLSPKHKVAVLSRGYKRKSKGFQIVQEDSPAWFAGDEPLQIKRKYPKTLVVVDKNRKNAIERILAMNPSVKPEVILMDDGFQHRRILPSYSILLVDSNRPVFEDELLPAGKLREPLYGKNRANAVIVTKCSRDMQPINYRIYENGLDLYPYQELLFSTFEYGNVVPVFPEMGEKSMELGDLRKKYVFLR